VRVAAIQMTSAAEVDVNLASARVLLAEAKQRGATLASLPENFAIMGRKESDKLAVAESEGNGPIQEFLSATAKELGMWIVGGTIPLRMQNEPNRVAAACLVFDDQGRRVGRYDKMHLFDVDLPDRNERYRESASIAPGPAPAVIDTPVGRMGLAVCYDVRFPELFRLMQIQGAEVLSIPAAFTAATGQAHWEVLMRARAIENLCYVVAPAQAGTHANGRETYGDSIIVDPWGVVLDRVMRRGPGVAVAEIDRTVQRDVRARFPALTHRRLDLSNLKMSV
jgi:deaminated glutathione amidase